MSVPADVEDGSAILADGDALTRDTSNMLLLIHRPRSTPNSHHTALRNDDASWKVVFRAASVITEITGLIMNYKSMHHCPLF